MCRRDIVGVAHYIMECVLMYLVPYLMLLMMHQCLGGWIDVKCNPSSFQTKKEVLALLNVMVLHSACHGSSACAGHASTLKR